MAKENLGVNTLIAMCIGCEERAEDIINGKYDPLLSYYLIIKQAKKGCQIATEQLHSINCKIRNHQVPKEVMFYYLTNEKSNYGFPIEKERIRVINLELQEKANKLGIYEPEPESEPEPEL
jgi:hypothetical protein